ncbi:MAG TPA: RND transporter, partial [Gammaproteobacteria bacterium]|nr:RND transporter [Gammaproteobacteria bacterium]
RQQQLQVAIQNLRLQRESLAIVTARVQAGRSTRFDQVRAQAQMESTAAILPQLQADIAALMHRIATLSGLPAGHMNAQLELVQDLPRQLPAVDLDTPAEVLRRRPDV